MLWDTFKVRHLLKTITIGRLFNSSYWDQLLWGFCYFLCCVNSLCKLGPAWQTIEFVYTTHHDFDGYFYIKKCVLYTGKYGTVEPCYLELKLISLGFALLFSVIYYWLSWTQLSQTQISNKEQHPLFLFYRQIYPTISNSQLYEQIAVSLVSSRLAGFHTVQLLVFV